MRSARSAGLRSFSRPSGISDWPEVLSSSRSARRITSACPSCRFRVIALAGLGGDQAGDDPAVLEGGGVAGVAGVDLAVRVEDRRQQGLGRLVGQGGEVGPDLVPLAAELVAAGADPAEDRLAPRRGRPGRRQGRRDRRRGPPARARARAAEEPRRRGRGSPPASDRTSRWRCAASISPGAICPLSRADEQGLGRGRAGEQGVERRGPERRARGAASAASDRRRPTRGRRAAPGPGPPRAGPRPALRVEQPADGSSRSAVARAGVAAEQADAAARSAALGPDRRPSGRAAVEAAPDRRPGRRAAGVGGRRRAARPRRAEPPGGERAARPRAGDRPRPPRRAPRGRRDAGERGDQRLDQRRPHGPGRPGRRRRPPGSAAACRAAELRIAARTQGSAAVAQGQIGPGPRRPAGRPTRPGSGRAGTGRVTSGSSARREHASAERARPCRATARRAGPPGGGRPGAGRPGPSRTWSGVRAPRPSSVQRACIRASGRGLVRGERRQDRRRPTRSPRWTRRRWTLSRSVPFGLSSARGQVRASRGDRGGHRPRRPPLGDDPVDPPLVGPGADVERRPAARG